MSLALLDTSVIIAMGQEEHPVPFTAAERPAVSAVTLAGLHHGALTASPERLTLRIGTLQYVQRSCVVLDVDEAVAETFGRIAADARRIRGRRIATPDGLIAATAATHRIPLYTRDADFGDLPGVDVRLI